MDTRTKHTIAQDRLVVAEQRALDVERRKSASHLQLLTFEQKQLEKKLTSLQNHEQSLRKHHRSISETNLHHIHQLNEISQSKFHDNLYHNNQNLLSLTKIDHFQSNEDTSESSDEDNSKSMKKKNIQPPIVTIIPPDED